MFVPKPRVIANSNSKMATFCIGGDELNTLNNSVYHYQRRRSRRWGILLSFCARQLFGRTAAQIRRHHQFQPSEPTRISLRRLPRQSLAHRCSNRHIGCTRIEVRSRTKVGCSSFILGAEKLGRASYKVTLSRQLKPGFPTLVQFTA